MKKTLEYTADRNQVLSLDELATFVTDARAVGFYRWAAPTVVVAPTTTRTAIRGKVKKISLEK